jgi:hypothetical protein
MKINKYGKIKWKFELYSATACGDYAFKCGGSPTNVSGFGTVSKIFVHAQVSTSEK